VTSLGDFGERDGPSLSGRHGPGGWGRSALRVEVNLRRSSRKGRGKFKWLPNAFLGIYLVTEWTFDAS
jgi:hypothetical protein